MKENRISIKIKKPIEEVFQFTINPENTHKWISGIEVEETNEWPIKIGTIYRNRGQSDDWNEYRVTELKHNELFELVSGNYHVRYTYKGLKNGTSEMEYYEWVDEGEIEEPFTKEILEKLKKLIEKTNGKEIYRFYYAGSLL